MTVRFDCYGLFILDLFHLLYQVSTDQDQKNERSRADSDQNQVHLSKPRPTWTGTKYAFHQRAENGPVSEA